MITIHTHDALVSALHITPKADWRDVWDRTAGDVTREASAQLLHDARWNYSMGPSNAARYRAMAASARAAVKRIQEQEEQEEQEATTHGDEGHHVDCASYLSDDVEGERYACDCTPVRPWSSRYAR